MNMKNCIPIIIKPYPDELLYSWIIRLAKSNGLSVKTFAKTYLGEDIFGREQYIPLDVRKGVLNFLNSLNIDEDKMKLYFSLSTTQFELSFYPERYQIKTINNIIRNNVTLNYINSYFIKTPKVCMECLKRDIEEYGEGYIHRSHQLSGVNVCYEHHTPLYTLNKIPKNKHEYDFNNIVCENVSVTEYDCKYAEYAHQLLAHNFSSNSDDIFAITTERLQNDKTLTKQELAHKIAELLQNPAKELSLFKTVTPLSPKETINILLQLFPNVNEFLTMIPHYDMVISKHCDICGCDFYTTNQSIKDGWGCVQCDAKISEQKLIKRLVKHIGNGDFVFKGETFDKQRRIKLYYKPTGVIITVGITKFLFTNAKYRCIKMITKEEAQKKFAKNKEFKLIEFTSINKPVEIYHTVCGHSFNVDTFEHFARNPLCRYCKEQKHHFDLEEFRQKVKDLVGDEYEVIEQVADNFNGEKRVKIRHNKCGEENVYNVKKFLSGSRCSRCREHMSNERINLMLNECSNGRYKLEIYDRCKNKLVDTKTGEEIFMTTRHVLQELLRPTPSDILKIDKDKEIQELTSWNMWYNLCIDYKNEFGHLFTHKNEKFKGKKLNDWCQIQRKLYKDGKLPEEQMTKLEAIEFVFDTKLYMWMKRFEEYKEYVRETGKIVPSTSLIHNGHKVGSWVNTQRTQKKENKLNPIYEKLLLEFNPDFFNM